MAKPLLHESDGLLNPKSNMDRFVDNDSKENTKTMDNWKVSLISGSCACTAVFIVNLGFTIWSSVSLKDIHDSTKTSRRIMYEGSCSTTRNMSLVIHLVINVFGSVLLSASNYGMQCLSTPTRADVDRAHAQGKWVDIGIPSFRNLSKVSARRAVLWWLLVLSSVPLHLLLNSVVYSSLSSYSYEVFVADRDLHLLENYPRYRCRLNFDISIASIVLVVNFVKAIVLAFIVIRPPKEPLFVLGDAIQSFMTRPDENSCGSCLTSARTVHEGLVDNKRITAPERRGVAVTRTRWLFSFVMYGVAFGVSCGLMVYGISQIYGPNDFKSLWGLGFGTANELTLIYGSAGFSNKPQREPQNIFPKVLISNIPQLIFSILYFQYNSLYTAMAAAKEWSDFGRKRRPLRVSSSPRGQQRSRYFLQLPYRYSIPLILVSILVHWMLSQSIFIVIVEEYEKIVPIFKISGTVVTCGYSPLAIICVVTTSGLMAVAIIITALRRLPTGMPVAASCSLAIAAACRQPDGVPHPEEASLLPLQWGVMTIERKGSDREITDHCGFSHEPVEKPEDGHMYY
ncbi:hypothetical protein HYE68_007661 [Fusarium pseudograminearum]|nr:hypothetical protein HYE68_007661 [Fusarium pseudograminearum]